MEWQTVAGTPPEWYLLYVPGPHALQPARALPPDLGEAMALALQEPGAVAHAALHTRPGRRRARPAAGPQRAGQDETTAPSRPAADHAPAAPSPAAEEALRTQAHALVQHFHQRFHGTPDVAPSARARAQAHDLIVQYGLDQARHLVDFSVTAVQETDYRPQTFGGILQYTARALTDYEHAQQRAAAEESAREERRRAQADEQRRQQYEDDRAARLAQLRATTPPDVLAAIEQAAATHFERDNTNPFGRGTLRRYAIEAAVAAHFQLPSFAEWQAT